MRIPTSALCLALTCMALGCAGGSEETPPPAVPETPTTAAAPAKTEATPTPETPKSEEAFLADPSATPPPAETKLRIEDDKFTLPSPIAFETGGARLLTKSEPALEALAGYLVARADMSIVRVEGHAAKDSDEAKNQALSEARAMAVARWLKLRGVDCKRLVAVGFGSTKPIADKASAEGKEQNTRIVISPAALRGRLIGSRPAEGGGNPAGDVCK